MFTPYHLLLTDFTIARLAALSAEEADEDDEDMEEVTRAEHWSLLLRSLTALCANDKEALVDGEQRLAICRALLAQVDGHQRCRDPALLVSAFGALAQEAEVVWKPLHSGLLRHTRSPDARVRVLCCQALRQVWQVVGEELLTLFPESLPFLSELLEDASPEVERETQQLCLVIQQYLGEDISTYFSQ